MPRVPGRVCSALVVGSVLQTLIRLIEVIVLPKSSNPPDYLSSCSVESREYFELHRITGSNTECVWYGYPQCTEDFRLLQCYVVFRMGAHLPECFSVSA